VDKITYAKKFFRCVILQCLVLFSLFEDYTQILLTQVFDYILRIKIAKAKLNIYVLNCFLDRCILEENYEIAHRNVPAAARNNATNHNLPMQFLASLLLGCLHLRGRFSCMIMWPWLVFTIQEGTTAIYW